MIFEPCGRRSANHVNVPTPISHLDGHVVERVYVTKFLGVHIDSKLCWSDHINYLISKISSLSGILYRNKSRLPLKCKKDIYFALIYPLLTYCIEIYANVSKSTIYRWS